ncbi:helix-turn-helix domain-containing protein [Halorientalis pallida]|jgi:predicted DNA binding protein|uniref:Helix-turn-helix domain-containing protein n=1 Tax=Halorientalis pallida TaxID=2479928 RepID=A0A498KWS7_9EURY|nr:helix-turn-helix domain-containing protein [Halorientalis pallida]RXK50081.1 helix-turn-helix domain-containing protein [Halorientalis pallida]
MSVIVEMEVVASDFELGRILDIVPGVRVEVETMVPAGERAVPLFWVYDGDRSSFESGVRDHPAVDAFTEIDEFEDRTLYAIDWDVEFDHFFGAIVENEGHVLAATGHSDAWQFELRFPDHDCLSAFQTSLEDARISFEVIRVYNPTRPDAGPWFGLTPTQREALVLAVECGYYDIPRTCTTVELAEKLDISDQAVTERLRRAIVNLVDHSLLVTADDID